MDPRRLLIPLLAALALGGCAGLRPLIGPPDRPGGPAPQVAGSLPAAAVTPSADELSATAPGPRAFARMEPIPNPVARPRPRATRSAAPVPTAPASAPAGRPAIAAANAEARAPSSAAGFHGGVQVFPYDPGRIYEVWTAPLRVTTLTLSPGETVVSKAAGDTVRWQIGETTSGAGPTQRSHVMIKPLQRGLETNLVLATTQRVYLLQLRSAGPDAFNAAVSWSEIAGGDPTGMAPSDLRSTRAVVEPATAPASLDARFRITPRGRPPSWTPDAVVTDGVRTYLAFPPGLASSEAPALFALSPGGERQLVNYRQQDGLWVVDRVLEAAELRLGAKRPQVVRIQRTGGPS